MRCPRLIAASLLGSALAARASPIIFDCPRMIDIEQTTHASDRKWELVPDQGLPPAALLTVAVYTQHPSDAGNLVPDQNERTAETETTSWRLPRDSAPYWVACVYANSRILLAKQVPIEAKQCRLTEALHDQKTSGVLSFVCE
jgi:hypothetical protein